MPLSEISRIIREGTTALYSATLTDENGSVVAGSSINTLTLTYYDMTSGTIINSRSAQTVLNTNNVTVNSSGGLTWTIQPEDATIVGSGVRRGETEVHIALFQWAWGGTKQGRYEVLLEIQQTNEIPLEVYTTLVTSYGGALANCYVGMTDATSFITTSIYNSSKWKSLDNSKKEAVLLEATRDIDSRNYVYGRYYADQNLAFPRALSVGTNITLTSSTLHTIAYTQQREAVKAACCHQAVWIAENRGRAPHADMIISGVKRFSKRVGPIQESYEYGSSSGTNPLCSTSRRLLSPWIVGPRVVRA